VELTVLGKSPAWQDASGACSGYLIREQGFSLLLDCGSGVLGKLRAVRDYAELDAIVISHLHPDHTFDLVPLVAALSYSRRAPMRRPALHLPPGGLQWLARLASLWTDPDYFVQALEASEYDPSPAAMTTLGPLTARFLLVPHFIPAFAVELTDAGGRRFTFGADCRSNDELVQFARDTDLLMLEATAGDRQPAADGGHMSAHEAGELARQAGAAKLVLTHFSDELDPDSVLAAGRDGFGSASVELASAGACFTL
jgi:ribonuclease BN (tRNA processing enzyme)